MSYEKYCLVIDELCHLTGLEDPDQFYETANLTVNDASFALMYGGATDSDSVVVFSDFGPAPEEKLDEIVHSLLTANMLMVPNMGRESFSINDVSGHILFCSVLPLPNATGKWLLQVLEHYAAQIKEWHKTMSDPEGTSEEAAQKMATTAGNASSTMSRSLKNTFGERK